MPTLGTTRAPPNSRHALVVGIIGASACPPLCRMQHSGGLFPVSTMLEKLGFKKLIEETLTIHRIPRAMTIYQFLFGMVLAIYVGFSRLNHLRFVAQDPMLTGILQVEELPPQCTFWRFL